MSDWDAEFDDGGRDVDAWQSVPPPVDGAPTDEDEALPPPPRFASVFRFVDEYLADIYRRDVNGSQVAWCRKWWAHGEAFDRLEALWRSWEHLRLDGATGMTSWWKDCADPTMAALFDPRGTFAGCSPERGHLPRLKPLPCDPMPIAELEWAMSDNLMREPQRPTTTTTEGTQR